MIVAYGVAELKDTVRAWRQRGDSIAFVPTMGNLHDGHIRLVEVGRAQANRVVVSIFVNPTQFCEGEDFDVYPRTPEQDLERLRSAKADLAFLPATEAIYPHGRDGMSFVEVPGLSEQLCGRFRPGHFRGVATIVCKLFHLVQPDVALFGEKDYQQLTLIRKMVADLDLPIRIEGVPTVREANGLALSSRNGYLSPAEKDRAATIYRTLSRAVAAIQNGERNYPNLEERTWEELQAEGLEVDYVSIRRQQDLAPPSATDRELVILAAARLGGTRLIDNIPFLVANETL
jgi:pantoate--beta-alanine ligase